MQGVTNKMLLDLVNMSRAWDQRKEACNNCKKIVQSRLIMACGRLCVPCIWDAIYQVPVCTNFPANEMEKGLSFNALSGAYFEANKSIRKFIKKFGKSGKLFISDTLAPGKINTEIWEPILTYGARHCVQKVFNAGLVFEDLTSSDMKRNDEILLERWSFEEPEEVECEAIEDVRLNSMMAQLYHKASRYMPRRVSHKELTRAEHFCNDYTKADMIKLVKGWWEPAGFTIDLQQKSLNNTPKEKLAESMVRFLEDNPKAILGTLNESELSLLHYILFSPYNLSFEWKVNDIIPEFAKRKSKVSPVFSLKAGYYPQKPSYLEKIFDKLTSPPDVALRPGEPKTKLKTVVHQPPEIFLENLQTLIAYLKFDQPELTQAYTYRAKTLNEVSSITAIDEYFTQKPYDKKLKVSLLTALVHTAVAELVIKDNSSPLSALHDIYTWMRKLDITRHRHIKKLLIPFLKVSEFANPQHALTPFDNLHKILKGLSPNEWYAIPDIFITSRWLGLSFEPVEAYYASINYHDASENPEEISAYPCMKAMVMALNTLGLLDVQYEDPVYPWWHSNKPYLSTFDGLRHVKLTPLGDAVINGNKKAIKAAPKQELAVIIFDPDRLHIRLSHPCQLTSLKLAQVAQEISPKLYLVSHATVFTGCATANDALAAIGRLEDLLPKDAPVNWQTFLHDMKSRFIYPEPVEYVTFKLDPASPLVELIIKAPDLAELVLRAENHQILIRPRQLKLFQKRLHQHGYFLDLLQ